MLNLFTCAMGVFLVGIVLGGHFGKRAIRCLGQEHRAALVTIAATSSLINLVMPIAVGLAYVVVVMNDRALMVPATLGALALLFVQSIISLVRADRTYRGLGMPPEFMRYFRIARGCRLGGLTALVVGVTAWLSTNGGRFTPE